jgi:excinuclease ABC subunit C
MPRRTAPASLASPASSALTGTEAAQGDAGGFDAVAEALAQDTDTDDTVSDDTLPWRIELDDSALPGEVADPSAILAPGQNFDFDERLRTAPDRPGVYLMKDRRGQIVYIGKASSLRARLRQYASKQDERFFVDLLDRVLGAIDLVVTASEKDALVLENELIKRHQPRFNVKLKDDKRFLHLRLDTDQNYPRLQVVRRPGMDKAQYFGPYASASDARATLQQINRWFLLRTCPDTTFRNRTRPCLEYQIGRCLGPCVLPVPVEDYHSQVRDVALFLSGRRNELQKRLKDKMLAAAEAEQYEQAAKYRDHMDSIQASLEQSHVSLMTVRQSMDAVGLYREGARLCAAILTFREGILIGTQGYVLKDQEWPDGEVLAGLLQRLYDQGQQVPDEVLLPLELPDSAVLATWLTDLRRQRAGLLGQQAPKTAVELVVPQRGVKVRLLEMASENAKQTFADQVQKTRSQEALLVSLQQRLHLTRLPKRIECYDISNISGTEPVGSMVVALDGAMAPKEYRHFTVRSMETPNDFAMMYEVLDRRMTRSRDGDWPLPDLIVIDGGKGQLKMAEQVLLDLGIDGVDLISLAKSRTLDSADTGPSRFSPERVFKPAIKNPIVLPQNSSEIYLLTQLRDEAHRFAITHHRKRRNARTLRSKLDGIPGVGPSRKKALLATFGSLTAVAKAQEADIAAVPGIGADLGARIVVALRGRSKVAADPGPTDPG